MASPCTLAFVYPPLEPPERPNTKLLDHPPPLAATFSALNIASSPLLGQGGNMSSSSSASSLPQLSTWRAGEVGLSQYSATIDHTIFYDSQGAKTVPAGQPLRQLGDFSNDPLLISTIQANRPSLTTIQAACDGIARRIGDGCLIVVQEVCLAPADDSMPSEPVYVTADKANKGKVQPRPTTWSFTLQGSAAQVEQARTAIRTEYQKPTGVVLGIERADALSRPDPSNSPSPPQLLPVWRERLDAIHFSTGAHVSVVPDIQARGGQAQSTCSIVVTGREEQVVSAKLQLLVFLDELRGLEATELTLDWRLHSMLSGPRNVVVSRIERDCNVNIYVAAPPFRRSDQDAGSLSASPSHQQSAFPTPSNSSPGLGLGLVGLSTPLPRSSAPLLTPPAHAATTAASTRPGRPTLGTSSSSDYFTTRHATASAAKGILNQVWITGSASAIHQAREAVAHTLNMLGRRIASKELLVPSHKIDWLVSEKGSDIRRFCRENGTFVSINGSSAAGSDTIGPELTCLTVGGESQIQIDRTVKQITHLLPEHCSLSVRLLQIPLAGQAPSTEAFAKLHAIVGNMAISTGAEVLFEDDKRFELVGSTSQVRRVGTYILEMLLSMSNVILDMRLRVECPLEHRDFISGKKEGKVKKVMQATGTRIRYEAISEYTFAIDVWGKDHSVLNAFDMIAAEMPAEGSFYLLEGFHKRIIGARGETIQAIMKRYGVYIKFASKQECVMNGGFIDPEDNVLMRTPAKNVASLEALRAEVMSMVDEHDRDFVRARVGVPRRLHRVLAHEKRHLLDHIQRNYQILVIYPGRIQCEDFIEIYGSEAAVDRAVLEIISLLPVEYKTVLGCNSQLPEFLASHTLPVWLLQINADLKVDVVACDPNVTGTEEAVFWMSCEKRFAANLSRAEQALKEVLAQNGVLSSRSRSAMREAEGQVPLPAGKITLGQAIAGHPYGNTDDFPPLNSESRIISVSDPPISPSRRLADLPPDPELPTETTTGAESASQSPSSGSPVAPSPSNRPLGAIGSEKPSRTSSISSRASIPLPAVPPPSMAASPSTRAGTGQGSSLALGGSPRSSRAQSLDIRELSSLSSTLKALTVADETKVQQQGQAGQTKPAADVPVDVGESSHRQTVDPLPAHTSRNAIQPSRTYAAVGRSTPPIGQSSMALGTGSAASIHAPGERWINPSRTTSSDRSSKAIPAWSSLWKQDSVRTKPDPPLATSSTLTPLPSSSSSLSQDNHKRLGAERNSDASIWAKRP